MANGHLSNKSELKKSIEQWQTVLSTYKMYISLTLTSKRPSVLKHGWWMNSWIFNVNWCHNLHKKMPNYIFTDTNAHPHVHIHVPKVKVQCNISKLTTCIYCSIISSYCQVTTCNYNTEYTVEPPITNPPSSGLPDTNCGSKNSPIYTVH